MNLNTSNWSILLSHHAEETSDNCFYIPVLRFHVCARCTGILIGLFLSSFLFTNIYLFKIIEQFSWVKILMALFLLTPLSVDGGLQYLEIRQSNKKRRFVSGLMFGAGVIFSAFYLSNLSKMLFFLLLVPLFFIMVYYPKSTKNIIQSNKRCLK